MVSIKRADVSYHTQKIGKIPNKISILRNNSDHSNILS